MILAWIITCIVIGLIVGSLTSIGIIGLIVGGWSFFVGLPTILKYSFIHSQVDRIVGSSKRSTDRITSALEADKPAYDLSDLYIYKNASKESRQKNLHNQHNRKKPTSQKYKDLVKKHLMT